ncbi:MAG: tetratricopeptide repeat protein [Pyrinomonadaceae bacterium]
MGCAVALALSACNRSAPQNDNRVASSNSNVAPTPTPQAFDSGQLDTEIARLEAEAEKNPDDDAARTTLAAAYVKRGDVLRAAHRNDEALRDYQNALRFNPDNEDAQLGLEQLNQEAGAAPRADDGKPVTVPAKKP